MNNVTKNIVKAVNDTTIAAGSVAAGATVSVYCINHDICNDVDMSTIVGVAAGAATTTITSYVVRGIENIILKGVSAIRGGARV